MFYIPVIAFFILLVAGVWLQELEIKHALVVVAIWMCGLALFDYFGLSRRIFVGNEAGVRISSITKSATKRFWIGRRGTAW